MSDITFMFHSPSTVSLAYVLGTILAIHTTSYTQDFLQEYGEMILLLLTEETHSHSRSRLC